MKLYCKDKYGYPIERIIDKPIQNFFRLLILTRSIGVVRNRRLRQQRIVKIEKYYTTTFKIQEKFFGLFWINPGSVGAAPGYYRTLEDAEEALKRRRTPDVKTIIEV